MIDEETKISRLIENAIEIADGNLPKLQDYFEKTMGRASIIQYFIVSWAYEAEKLWGETSLLSEEKDYYDFIDKFTSKKMEELLCQEICGVEKK
jgi:hypothetical protein